MRGMTVVVPAHNEAAVIARCLSTLLGDAEPGELDVVVVSNGSTDRTVELAVREAARHGWSLEVVDLPEPSKIEAVREGLRRAPGDVLVVDADVELPTATARSIAIGLAVDRPVVASARMEVDTARCSWPVRAYYRAWTALPYVTHSMVGSGVFALNAAARDRLGELPEVTNDDGWVRRSIPPSDRLVVPEPFTVHAARTARALVARRARIVNGNRQLGEVMGGRDTGGNSLRDLVRQVRARAVSSVDAGLFLALTAAARMAAAARRTRRDTSWSTDATSRTPA